MNISAIVPVWNGRELLERLLDTLDAQTQPAAELLVVDNGSTDGAPELARRRGARVIPMGRNAGFARAVNRGITESRGEWIAVLNSDVELAPDYLRGADAETGALVRHRPHSEARPPAHGDREIDAAFDAVCRGATAWRVGSGRADGPAFAVRARHLVGALDRGAVSRRAFPPRRPAGGEFRIVPRRRGFRPAVRARWISPDIYVPGAVAWHRGSAALGRWHPDTVRRIARNQILLVARHYPRACLLRWIWPMLVAQALWGGVALRHGAGDRLGRRGRGRAYAIFRAVRRKSMVCAPELLQRILRRPRTRHPQFQTSTGFDLYWRLYFLTRRRWGKVTHDRHRHRHRHL